MNEEFNNQDMNQFENHNFNNGYVNNQNNNKNDNWKNVLIGVMSILIVGLFALTIYVVVDKKDNGIDDNKDNNIQENGKFETTEKDDYSEKSYSEIINDLNVNNFNKNQFDGKFVVKKANNLSLVTRIEYYDINGYKVDKYEPEIVLVTWKDIKDYKNNLYNGLDINKKIPYTSHKIYRNNIPNETIFYLSAYQTDSSSDTIKNSFDNNNVNLSWHSNSDSGILASEVINVSNNKKDYNQFGVFIDSLGSPAGICRMPDVDKNDVSASEIEFDYIKRYELYWVYDEYYILMMINSVIKDDVEISESISQILVNSKNSNNGATQNYSEYIESHKNNCLKLED